MISFAPRTTFLPPFYCPGMGWRMHKNRIPFCPGNAAAKCSLSYCFDSGLGVKADKTKATELFLAEVFRYSWTFGWYKKNLCFLIRNRHCVCVCVWLYHKQTGCVFFHASSTTLEHFHQRLEESAAQGYATALFKLGCWHQYGRGGKVVNPDRAFELFNEAAKQGEPNRKKLSVVTYRNFWFVCLFACLFVCFFLSFFLSFFLCFFVSTWETSWNSQLGFSSVESFNPNFFRIPSCHESTRIKLRQWKRCCGWPCCSLLANKNRSGRTLDEA